MWESYDKCGSRATLKSRAEEDGLMIVPKKFSSRTVTSFYSHWYSLIRRNLVLSGFIERWLVKHHWAIRCRSFSSVCLAVSMSLIEKNMKTLVSSTYDSRRHVWGTAGRSFKYIENNIENNIISTDQPVLSGVPQGSILGLILFSLFVTNLPSCFKDVKALMYANDTVIFYAAPSQREVMSVLMSWAN